jgi:hypothetical protein
MIYDTQGCEGRVETITQVLSELLLDMSKHTRTYACDSLERPVPRQHARLCSR